MSKECKVCQGSRHRWSKTKNAYVPCVCLARTKRIKRYRKAGIPKRYDDETWRTFTEQAKATNVKRLLAVARTLKEGDNEAEWPLVHGHPASLRNLAVALTLRSACDGDLPCARADVSALIDAEFNKNGEDVDYHRVKVLVVEVGSEPRNKWHTAVMEKLLRIRFEYDRFTMLLVTGDVPRIAASFKSAAVTNAFSDQFFKVKITPKEDK